MEAALCASPRVEAVKRTFWSNSLCHSESAPTPTLRGRLFAAALKLANLVAWVESRLLRRVRAGSAGVLLTARPLAPRAVTASR
jgi:hypothetical protein